ARGRRRPAVLKDLERIVAWRGLHGYPAQLGELVDARLAAETAETAALDAAERHLGLVVHGGAVDVADAGLDAGRHLPGARGVLAEHRRRQAVVVVVGDRDGLFDAVDAHNALYRPERLVAVDFHVRRDVVDEGGGNEGVFGLAAA